MLISNILTRISEPAATIGQTYQQVKRNYKIIF